MTKKSQGSGVAFDPSPFRKQHDKVLIVGFAPHHVKAPIQDPDFDVWSLNELYTVRPELKERTETAGVWWQMHGYEPPTQRDPKQREWLANLKAPVVMWWEHPQIPNSVRFPMEAADEYFFRGQPCGYWTNSVSYMLAMAIMLGYKHISMFGVDMAQEQEMRSQRPSCEFFLGWARAVGIEVVMPPETDMLKSWVRYGQPESDAFLAKMQARADELEQRRTEVQQEIQKRQQEKSVLTQQLSNANAREHQVLGAMQVLTLNPQPTQEVLEADRTQIRAEIEQIEERRRVLDQEIGGLNAWDHQLIGAQSDNEYMVKLGPPCKWEPPLGARPLVPLEAETRKWCPAGDLQAPEADPFAVLAPETVTVTEVQPVADSEVESHG